MSPINRTRNKVTTVCYNNKWTFEYPTVNKTKRKKVTYFFKNYVTEQMASSSRTYQLRTRSRAGLATQAEHASDASSQGNHGEDHGHGEDCDREPVLYLVLCFVTFFNE